MKKILLLSFFYLSATSLRAQTAIALEDVGKHVGDSVQVCGVIAGGIYLQKAENTPTFLNMGAKYPNQQLTIVIWADVRKQFTEAPEVALDGHKICVKGRIEMFRGKPQIVLRGSELISRQDGQ